MNNGYIGKHASWRIVPALLGVVLLVTTCSRKEEKETSPAVSGTGTVASAGAGLVQKRCTICHTTKRIDKAAFDRAGWERTVDKMIDKGARLDDAERKAVIDYLASR